GGYRESGYGREGGREGMYEYLVPDWHFRDAPVPAAAADEPEAEPEPARAAADGLGEDVALVVERLGDDLDDSFAGEDEDDFAAFAAAEEFGFTDEEAAQVVEEVPDAPVPATPEPEEPAAVAPDAVAGEVPAIDATPKLYIGGRQVRPDSGYSYAVASRGGRFLGEVGLGNRKDIRNAVEAARKAGGWSGTTAHNRAQVLYYLAENLSQRAGEFSDLLDSMDDTDAPRGTREVEASISRIYSYAAWADKYDGRVHATPYRNVTLAMNEPWGVLGAVAPSDHALLGLLSLVLPALALGNRVVAVPSTSRAAIIGPLVQLLETSDVPAGALNLVTGKRDELAAVLARHDDVDSLWYCGSRAGAALVEEESTGNLKPVWTIRSAGRDWFDAFHGEGGEFLRRACQVKNIWVPYGE
ncbi:MAG TPA: aldehyde dehydrogenase family protein, partial [Deinococcales bacterium]|nr:aldehyde dehydrogenase family protein [Deinococcales bacterium]